EWKSSEVAERSTGENERVDRWAVAVYGRVDSVCGELYVGSVIVNECNGRCYEPARGRNYGVGRAVGYQFDSL
ncbi:hypothetical protein, partial [Escherichia coli]|uniref:hypothetical protein n=1 Tax=Escherichia coli TaxID=562 RepID=UPI001BC82CF8